MPQCGQEGFLTQQTLPHLWFCQAKFESLYPPHTLEMNRGFKLMEGELKSKSLLECRHRILRSSYATKLSSVGAGFSESNLGFIYDGVPRQQYQVNQSISLRPIPTRAANLQKNPGDRPRCHSLLYSVPQV